MRIGIDLGGTKIEGIALRGSDEVARMRVRTPRDDYPGTVDAIVDLVAALEQHAGSSATVGVGIPGTISAATGRVKNANSVWLIGRPLLADLERRLDRKVRMANDANCFAVSEAADGAAAGAEVVFGVIVGTGTGAGIVVRGEVVTGPNGIAGEWGHNPLPWPTDAERPGPPCYCGRHGCVETFLSGPGLQADYERHARRLAPVAQGRPNMPRTTVQIVEEAARGDEVAGSTLARYAERMARALAGVINVLDPNVIVLGGGMSNIASLYEDVPRLWAPFVFSDPVLTRLVRAKHGDASGVRGAAWLWPGSEGL
jgi:fructokinase